MANIIRHRRSGVAGLIPVAPDLTLGELALNCADGRIFTLLTSGAVVDLAIPTEVDGGRITVPGVILPAGYNSANYGSNANWNTALDGNVLSVGTSGGQSAYGTFDQSGNVYEFLQSGKLRGGSYVSAGTELSSTAVAKNDSDIDVTIASSEIGFRIASLTNPTSLPDFVVVGDANNAANFNGIGRVDYSYYISRYAITNAQYAEFLNATAKNDIYGLYSAEGQQLFTAGNLSLLTQFNTNLVAPPATKDVITRGIAQNGTSGNYTYAVLSNMADKPVNYISLSAAARYCNWLHNNRGDTENGSYTMAAYVPGAALPPRNVGARYFIPTENEWYKAAYYKAGGAQSGYWRYATQSDTLPAAVCATNIGIGTILCGGTRLTTTSGNFLFTQFNDTLITAQDL